jgi:hypothetical protein
VASNATQMDAADREAAAALRAGADQSTCPRCPSAFLFCLNASVLPLTGDSEILSTCDAARMGMIDRVEVPAAERERLKNLVRDCEDPKRL